MKNFKDLLFSIKDEDWLPLTQDLASEEHSGVNRFLVQQGVVSPEEAAKLMTPHPASSVEKVQQLQASIGAFQQDYIRRIKAGFTLVLNMLGEMAEEDGESELGF